MEFKHVAVLLNEAVDSLHIEKGKKYIDATAGGGGHSGQILTRGGQVLAIDQDKDAITYLNSKFNDKDIGNIQIAHGNFANIGEIARKFGFEHTDGILFDLGLSSYQLEGSGRGFSFRRDEKLDMRMGESDLTARDIINFAKEEELVDIFLKYGEEHDARKIAKEIITARKIKKIEKSSELANIIRNVSGRAGKLDPATRVFQALRITVNHEIENLKLGLDAAFEILNSDGRIVVISFHSLEDRVVKSTFRKWEKEGRAKIITKNPVVASEKETRENPRARSAKMRVIEKLA